MPQTMPPNEVAQGFLTGTIDQHDGTGAHPISTLPSGQTPQVVSADTATVTVALDSPALPPVDSTGKPLLNPDGTPVVSFASFKVTSLAAPANPNKPITITLNILNADGTVAATGSDTETVVEGATETVGDLILAAVPVPPARNR